MNVVVYISHPSQYHFFKNPINGWKRRGHQVMVVIRSKDILEDLLIEDQLPYVNILPEARNENTTSILHALAKRIVRLFILLRHFKPDLLIGSDASLPIVARLLKAKSITTLEDDYNVIKPLAMLTYPLTHVILTPFVCQTGRWEKKKAGYHGYMKLSALHPNQFTYNPDMIKSLVGEKPYCLIRLSALNAYHDKGIQGLSTKMVQKVILSCEKQGLNVWINSEKDLPEMLQQHHLIFHPALMHQLLAGAKLLISDSQSMSVEAAMLGIPSLRFSDFAGKISVLEELEHTYRLTKGIKTDNPEQLLQQLEDWLLDDTLSEQFQLRKVNMLRDKIDVASFVTWFVEDYSTNPSANNACDRFMSAVEENQK
ncbi:MAG: DUF354 domain-containing protein [Microbacter sp.]